MPRLTSPDFLAFQLEQAKSGRPASMGPTTPPSSSVGASPHLSSTSSTPSTPATPWLDVESNTWYTSDIPVGLGIAGRTSDKPCGMGAVQDNDIADTDDESENELNDFGYGAPKRRTEKKETLLDVLNSEPPDWMVRTPSDGRGDLYPHSSNHPKRSDTLSRLKKRFGSTGPDLRAEPAADSFSGLSTLRTSRSAGNLLNSLRGRLGGSPSGTNRSRDDISSSPAATLLPANVSQSGLPYSITPESFSAFNPRPPLPVPKPAPKEASSAGASTRDLADFFRSSGPSDIPLSIRPSQPSSRSLGAKPRTTLHRRPSSTSGAAMDRSTRSSHTAASSEAGSVEAAFAASTGGGAIIRAAMAKLGTAGRRTSLTPLARFGGSAGVAAPTRAPRDRERSGSSDGAGCGTIGIDDELVLGMFGCASPLEPHFDMAIERRRCASVGAASALGLPVETLAGDLVEKAAAGLYRSSSHRSTVSHSPFSSPRVGSPQRIARKPVPAAIPPIEELLVSSSPPRSSPYIKLSTIAALQQLHDRGDTSPLAVGESPVKGFEAVSRARARSLQTFAVDSPGSPLTPSTAYATPPLSPSACVLDDMALPRSRPTTSESALSLSTLLHLPPLVLAAAAARPPSPALDAPLLAPPPGSVHSASQQRSMTIPQSIAYAASEGAAAAGASTDAQPGAPLAETRADADDALLAALDALRVCLSTAAALPPSVEPAGSAEEPAELVARVVPVLRGLSAQMRRGARLVDEVLARLRDAQGRETGKDGRRGVLMPAGVDQEAVRV